MPMKPWISPLQILLLVQLEASSKYGYEMLKSIKDAFEGVWEPKTGTIYPAIKSLEKRALIETQVRDNVDFYHITPSGRKLLMEIGSQQTLNLKFSSRFIETLTKWMSPELKKGILTNMAVLASENLNFMGGFIHFLDDGVEKEEKLQILKNLRSILSTRVVELDERIRDLEAETF
jgi:DNA-binding PadR family transcriptional regulator